MKSKKHSGRHRGGTNRAKRRSNIDIDAVLKTLKKNKCQFAGDYIDFTVSGARKAAERGNLMLEKAILLYAIECAGFDVLGLINSKFDTKNWFKK